jgi:hypothetical protein
MPPAGEFVVDFPTLWIVADWIERHCTVQPAAGQLLPFVMYDWQLWSTVNHYRVKPTALPAGTVKRDGSIVAPSAAFFYRRSQIVAPQKTGKGPWSAAIICAEAVGPVVFAGFAAGGEVYRCVDHGCLCGWTYRYQADEPMGVPWVRAVIQILASSEDQTDNVYHPLQTMARGPRLAGLMRVGEGFIRLPNEGRIDPVTSKANSKLGNPITFALQDETGIYLKSNKLVATAQTQRRGAAGMGGRSMETTNAWDPTENSVAQQTATSRQKDIFRFHRIPPAHLSYKNKAQRRKIHQFVYAGSKHVDLDGVEAEAAELMETDPAQAERFFGNRLVQGAGSWLTEGLWESRKVERPVPPDGTEVCAGFDGSESNDWTAIRLRTLDGFRFTPTYGPDKRPTCWNPAEWGGSIPRGEVKAAWDEICRRYKVIRAYCDPRDWQSEIGDLALEHGGTVFLEWATYRVVPMHEALVRTVNDLISGRATHDNCPITAEHVGNARKIAKPGDRYILGKPNDHQKIDMAMADVLAWQAGEDARQPAPAGCGWGQPKSGLTRVRGRTSSY